MECHGSWTFATHNTSKNAQFETYPLTHLNNYGNYSEMAIDFIHNSDINLCPFEELIFNCGFRNVTKNHPTRTKNKYWLPSSRKYDNVDQSSICRQFHPILFLSLITNRKIVFAGDSIMFQIWSSIACSLSLISRIDNELSILRWKHETSQKYTCPLGKFHCHMEHGKLYFPEYNATIIFDKTVYYRSPDDTTIQNIIERNKIESTDVMFYNFGLWIDDVDKYKRMINDFLTEVREIKQAAATTSFVLPPILFLETLPQHFHTPNGYFNSTNFTIWFMPCEPLSLSLPYETNLGSNTTSHDQVTHWREEHDWRNTVVKDAIASTDASVDIVGLADGLYSQWDEHIDLSDIVSTDCTHYCSHSAVFQFIKATLQHALASILT